MKLWIKISLVVLLVAASVFGVVYTKNQFSYIGDAEAFLTFNTRVDIKPDGYVRNLDFTRQDLVFYEDYLEIRDFRFVWYGTKTRYKIDTLVYEYIPPNIILRHYYCEDGIEIFVDGFGSELDVIDRKNGKYFIYYRYDVETRMAMKKIVDRGGIRFVIYE